MKNIISEKNCFLTGATGGLGIEFARKLAKKNCNLFLTSTNEKKLKGLKNDLEKINPKIKIFFKKANLTKQKEIESLIFDVRKKIKEIDILINCAGVFPVSLIKDSTMKTFDNCFNINIKAPYIFCREFSEDMKNKKWGRIVNIGSSSSYNGFKKTSVYCSTKHALLGLSRSLQDELKEFGVRVICISPRSIKTPMGEKVENQNFETFINPTDIAEVLIQSILLNNEMVMNEIRLNRMVIE